MDQLVTFLLPGSDLAVFIPVVLIAAFTLVGVLLALVQVMTGLGERKILARGELLRTIPLNRSLQEYHDEARSLVGKDNLLATTLEQLHRLGLLRGKNTPSSTNLPLALSDQAPGLELLTRAIMAAGLLGACFNLFTALSAKTGGDLETGSALLGALSSLGWAVAGLLVLAPFRAFRDSIATGNRREFDGLIQHELLPRYLRDTTHEEVNRLFAWSEDLFDLLRQASGKLEQAARDSVAAAELLHNASKNVQVEQEKLTIFVDAFEKGTERLLAYKDDVNEVLERFFAIDEKIFENHHHFNARVEELYEHLEAQNKLLLDLREELTKNETARVDLIEEFLKREDVVLGEVKRAVKIMAEASTPPLPKESLPRRENEGRRRSPSGRPTPLIDAEDEVLEEDSPKLTTPIE